MRVLCLAVLLLAAGCGSPGNVSCKADAECVTRSLAIVPADASPSAVPRCCDGMCLLPSPGCDSGFRYLTDEPAFGVCAGTSSCQPQATAPARDMN
jgi:hypothetical protein